MSRGPDKQFDPEIALDKAMHLFWAKGYAATGLSELLATMGIGRKSLYDTFGNKRALFVKALERYSQTVVDQIHRDLNNPGKPALENIQAVMRDIAAANSKPLSAGCLLGVSMAEFRTDDKEMAGILRKHMRGVERAYRKAFARAQAERDLKPTTDVQNLARLFMGAHQGLVLIGRVTESGEIPKGVVEGALATLEAA